MPPLLKRISTEYAIFICALTFLTRIPSPGFKPLKPDYKPEYLQHAARYFSLVGALVGALIAAVYVLLTLWFPVELSLVLALAFGVMVTGAFHEDGLADCADGFGGGFTKKDVLRIMHDSRLGTYGVTTLIFLFLIKVVALNRIAEGNTALSMVAVFMAVHGLSRAASVITIATTSYVSASTEESDEPITKSKPVVGAVSATSLIVTVLAVSICLAFMYALSFSIATLVGLIISAVIITYLCRAYCIRRLGGITGDCLGGIQQLTEVGMLLVLVGLL